VLQLIGLAFAIAATTALCVLPSFESVTTDSSGHERVETLSILEVQGVAFLVVLLVPVIIAVIPLVLNGRAWHMGSIVVAILLGGLALVGALSIGRYYLPAVIIEIVAACLPIRRRAGR
jgi:hypothetical protein